MRSIAAGEICSFVKFQTEEEELKEFSLFSLRRNGVGIFNYFLWGEGVADLEKQFH